VVTDNIVKPEFGKVDKACTPVQEKQVWVCGECDNRTFNLFNDSTIMCAYCEQVVCDTCADTEGWRKCLPPSPEHAAKDTKGTMQVHHTDAVEFARARTWRELEAWVKAGRLEFIYGGDIKGATRAWVGVDNDKDRASLLEQMQDFMKYVEGLKFGEPDENVAG